MSTHVTAFPVNGEDRPLASPPSYSTSWMPLDEPRHSWASFSAEATLPQALTATGHAFFALAFETKALRHFTFATEQQRHSPRFAKDADLWYSQAEHALYDATHHWSRAAYLLDTLRPTELAPDELEEVRTLSRQARAQQERLWRLTDEVRAAITTWQRQQQQARQAIHAEEVLA